MSSIVEQELAIRIALPTAIPPITGVSPHAIPAAGTILVKDSNTAQLTYVSAPMPGSNVPYSNTNLPAVSGSGILWFDPINGWLKFRKKSEDSDPNVYVISLSDPLPE